MDRPTYPTAGAIADIYRHHREHAGKRFLEFLATIPPEDFVRPFADAGGKSMRDCVLHDVGATEFWFALLQGRPHERFDAADFPTLASILTIADRVGDRVSSFLAGADEDWFVREGTFSIPGDGRTEKHVPAWVAVHVLTHGYHHKGQAVLMARLLGHEPPETDFL